MRLPRLFSSRQPLDAAHALYVGLVQQARQPAFYRDWQVPDSLDGRFDMIAVHAFLALRRLKAEGEEGKLLAQTLFDVIFGDLDSQLREMGIGDLGVGKRVKGMAKALYGRIAAYEAGLESADDGALEEALRRNLYGTATASPATLAALGAYMRDAVAMVDAIPRAEILAGTVRFPEPPRP